MSVRAQGWRAFALSNANGGFNSGVLSDDDDGIMRYYVDCTNTHKSVNEAMFYAAKSQSEETYRSWSDCYKLVGGDWKPK